MDTIESKETTSTVSIPTSVVEQKRIETIAISISHQYGSSVLTVSSIFKAQIFTMVESKINRCGIC
jgi:hypothetical protein